MSAEHRKCVTAERRLGNAARGCGLAVNSGNCDPQTASTELQDPERFSKLIGSYVGSISEVL